MYTDFVLNFTVGKAKKTIPYTIGVHQGDNLAPILFNLFFQAAIDSLETEWIKNQIERPTFKWFSSDSRGRLRNQSPSTIGHPFSYEEKSLR